MALTDKSWAWPWEKEFWQLWGFMTQENKSPLAEPYSGDYDLDQQDTTRVYTIWDWIKGKKETTMKDSPEARQEAFQRMLNTVLVSLVTAIIIAGLIPALFSSIRRR